MNQSIKRQLKATWVVIVGRAAFSPWLRVGFRLAAWGLGYDVHENRPVSRPAVGIRGLHEPAEISFYETPAGKLVLKRARVIWDIGANRGHWSIAIAQRIIEANDEYEIHLFEPNPSLQATLREVDFGEVRAYVSSSAIGASPAVGNLLIPEGGAEHGFINSDSNVGWDLGSRYSGNTRIERSIEISIASVDTQIARGMPTPDLMKVDVEGTSRDVLVGAALTLKSNPNLVIQFEGDYSWMAYRNEIRSLLGDRVVNRILPSGQLLEVGNRMTDELYAYCNLIAIRRDFL